MGYENFLMHSYTDNVSAALMISRHSWNHLIKAYIKHIIDQWSASSQIRILWWHLVNVTTTTTTTVSWPPGLCPGLRRWPGTRKVKPVWIYWSKR